jgi:hypothetical protein
MFTDQKYSNKGNKGGGVGVKDAIDYLFDEIAAYLGKDHEQDLEGLGLTRFHGGLWESLGVITTTPEGKALAVDKETFRRIMEGDHPTTGLPLKNWRKDRSPGSEIVLAPDGDVSLFYSRASLEEKRQIREMIQRATAKTIEVMEKEVCKIRITETDEHGNKIQKDVSPNGGIGLMEFNHFEARMVQNLVESGEQTRPDCSVHAHLSAPSVAVHNGQVYSLENSYLKNAQTQCDMVYKNELYNDMSQTFGLKFKREIVEKEAYQTRSKESYRFRIDGFTDEMRDVHGHRTVEAKKEVAHYLANKIKDAEAHYKALGQPVPASVYNQKIDPKLEKEIARGMRAKKGGFSQREMVAAWETEWDAKGFTHAELTKILEQGKALDPQERFQETPSPEALMDLLTSKKQGFTQKEFRDLYLQNHAGTGKSYEQMNQEIQVALEQHGIELKPEGKALAQTRGRVLDGENIHQRFTSRKLHEAEKNALAYVIENKARKSKVSITQEVALAGIKEWEEQKSIEMKMEIRLNREQRQAAVAMCVGEGGVVCAISGHAGTGKTFAIQAAEHCLTKAGFTQAGTAVSGRAGENLYIEALRGEKGTASASSLAAFLARHEAEGKQGRKVELPNVLYLDEAATANSDMLARVLKIGAESKADFRVIATYDFKQTQAIGPTGLLRDIIKEVGEQELKEVKRQKTPEALAVAQLAREGKLSDLRDHMSKQTRFDQAGSWFTVKQDRESQIKEIAGLWHQNKNPVKQKLIVTLLRKDGEEVNQAVRDLRIANGEIDAGIEVKCSYRDQDSELELGRSFREEKIRHFSVGDRIIIKEGFKVSTGKTDAKGKPIKESILTGYAGEIIKQNPNDAYMTVRFDNGKEVSWDFAKDKQNGVDHFYAGTVNSTQGASVAWCAGMDAEFGRSSPDALGENRNLLYTMLSRHGQEANLITTEALDQTFEKRYGAYGLEESTLQKVVEAPTLTNDLVLQPAVQPSKEIQHGTKSSDIINPANPIIATHEPRSILRRFADPFGIRAKLASRFGSQEPRVFGMPSMLMAQIKESSRERGGYDRGVLRDHLNDYVSEPRNQELLIPRQSDGIEVEPIQHPIKALEDLYQEQPLAVEQQPEVSMPVELSVPDPIEILNQHFTDVLNKSDEKWFDVDFRGLLEIDAGNGIQHNFNESVFENGDSYLKMAIRHDYKSSLEFMISDGAKITPEIERFAVEIESGIERRWKEPTLIQSIETGKASAIEKQVRALASIKPEIVKSKGRERSW